MRARLAELHEAAARARRADVRRLRRARRASSRRPAARRRSCRCPPTRSRAPRRRARVVAVSLGHLGRRTDWALLRAVAERLGDELVRCWSAPGTRTRRRATRTSRPCRAMPQFVWLGAARRRGGRAADPLRRRRDRPVPRRAVQRRRRCPTGSSSTPGSGRRTVTPTLAGVRTWDARRRRSPPTPTAFAAALRASAGARARPDVELRALGAARRPRAAQNGPLWDAARSALGIAGAPERRRASRAARRRRGEAAVARDRDEAGVGHVRRRARAGGEAEALELLAADEEDRDAARRAAARCARRPARAAGRASSACRARAGSSGTSSARSARPRADRRRRRAIAREVACASRG